jgi:predicted glycosyltransferase
MTGNTTKFTSKCHQYFIKKYNECWIPDTDGDPNLTGNLGHLKKSELNLKYIGPLSRMRKKDTPKQYDLMIILSGPEPQRTLLEEKLQAEITRYKGEIVFIKGIVEKTQTKQQIKNVTYYNFMNTKQLEQTFNESDLVLCRSGYTTVMDLAKLGKKAFFIPTPGQYEQEYLAIKLQEEQLVPYATQNDFTIEDLSKVKSFKGLSQFENKIDWESLFTVFE